MQNSVLCYLENTVKRIPDHTAVVDSEHSISFFELRQKALRIASVIKNDFGIEKKPVLVYVPKSVESIICFMGVLYSGNFYTPTDVTFPFEKVNGVIKKLEPAIYLSDSKSLQKLVDNGIDENQILNIDKVLAEPLASTTNELEKLANDSLNSMIDTDLVYALFTSGSTGVPKGVAITNRSIIDYIDWAKECYQIDETHKIGNQAPFYFDNSTLDIYLMLSTGATLYIVPKMYYAFPAKLMQYVVEEEINTIFWVPSVLINVANYNLLEELDCSCLKKILFAGEVMPNKQLNYWRKYLPNALYSNLYGPTEITVDCTYYTVDREFADDEPLPIGVPCKNSDVLILDENDLLIRNEQVDVIGELCVRGSSLAVGYWNDFEKTNEVFTQNPLNKNYPEKIYRTGDLVYYNSHGEIMFAGRKDFQIKHMGYRIELGEIETAALGFEKIENVCTIYDNEKKQIVLFYQGDASVKEVRGYLGKIIPKYMMPAMYYELKEFPYNDNGKIDRKVLRQKYEAM